MVEVFITNIRKEFQTEVVRDALQNNFSGLEINFDLDESELQYPCGHTVLRVMADNINPDEIMKTVDTLGFVCEIMEDRVCS